MWCVCVRFISSGLFPLPNNLGNNLSGETNYISYQTDSHFLSRTVHFTSSSSEPFPFLLLSSPFASFCAVLIIFLISYFHSLPLSH